MKHLIEWDSIELRIDGERLDALVRSSLVSRSDAIERLTLRFTNGLLRIEGRVRTLVSVPFSIDIRELVAAGRRIRVPLGPASAFGAIPIPHFLFRMARNRLPQEFV